MRNALTRFFVLVIVVGLVVPIAAMFFVEPVDGDLTRIGFLPEREFGWNLSQPLLLGRASNASTAEATVLVLGDSFSRRGLWQQIALGQREKYVTIDDQRLCSDLASGFRRRGLTPRVVVIETVERTFSWRFFEACETSKLGNLAPNDISPDQTTRNRSIVSGSFGMKYTIGSLLYFLHPGEQHRPGDFGGVFVKRVSNGCAFFSNLNCEFGLFLGDDSRQPALPLATHGSPVFDQLRKVGVKRILIVSIPNKTSAYFQSPAEAALKDAYLIDFGKRNGAEVVVLNQRFLEARSQMRDFYLPNNTHLSPRGEEVLGNLIGDALRNENREVAAK